MSPSQKGVHVSLLKFPVGIRHVRVDSGSTSYKFLHDPAIASYNNSLVAAWYNCPDGEIVGESSIRGRRSTDGGFTWSETEVLAEDREKTGIYYVPVQLFPFRGSLYSYVGTMTGHDRIVNTTTFQYVETEKKWQKLGAAADLFLPNCAPVQAANGNWLIAGRVAAKAGELPLIPAVMISQGDDIAGAWRVVKLQELQYPEGEHPETTLIVDGERILAFTRRNSEENIPAVYVSDDNGENWKLIAHNNLSAYGAKLYAGRLQDGRGFLTFNYPVAETADTGLKARSVLALAVSERGGNPFSFSKIYKIQEPGEGRPEISHYPSVAQVGDSLYVIYTAHFKEPDWRQCELAIVPVGSL